MARPFRWTMDVQTKVRRKVELTDAEIADAQVRAAAEAPIVAARLAREARQIAFQAEAADTFIDSLRGATPAQIKTFVQNNTADIGEVRILLTKLAVAVAYALAGGSDK